MKTQNRNLDMKYAIFVVIFAALITITIRTSAQEAGRDSVPASPDNLENVEEQKICRHEFSFWAAGGFSTFNIKPNFGERDYGLGGAFGLGYSFNFSKNWSILAGAEFAIYNTKMIVDDLRDEIKNMYDPDGNSINYVINLERYVERDRLYAINIPLMLQFQTKFSDSEHAFFFAVGAKAGFPLSMKYELKEVDFLTYGDYLNYGQWLFDQGDLGYGNHKAKIKQEQIDMKLSWSATAEIGIKWNLKAPRLNLYTGFYFDYGFNEIRKDEANRRFLEYDHDRPERMRLNSLLASEYSHKGTELKKFTDKVSTLSFGLKIRLGINTCPGEKNNKDKNKYSDEYPNDPYHDGYSDAYKAVIDDLINSLNSNPKRKPETTEQEPEKTKKIEDPYYSNDPLIQAEIRRATKEYGKLANMFILYIDGYEIDQTELSPIMEMMIDDKLPLLEEYNNDKYIIICEGHTCDLADYNYNKNLGQRRAEVVKQYLIQNGFKAENIIPTSKGKTVPIVYNTNEYNRKLNRRVVFIIKEKR